MNELDTIGVLFPAVVLWNEYQYLSRVAHRILLVGGTIDHW